MRHSEIDGVAAVERATSSYSREWHPMLAAREVATGHWWMIDGLGHPYGEVQLVKRGTEVGYRADRSDEHGVRTVHIGYFRSLRASAAAIHTHFIRSHGAPSSREYGR